MQLNSNGKTVNINLGILQSYSVRIIGRLYWFADTAGNITVTLNSISQLVTVPASITYTSCPDSSMSYRALNFSLTFT